MAAILLSLVGFTACSEDDDEKEVFDDVTTELTEDVIYSFSYDNATMFETATVQISLFRKESPTQSFTTPKDITFPIVVDETSTAVEGTHLQKERQKELSNWNFYKKKKVKMSSSWKYRNPKTIPTGFS